MDIFLEEFKTEPKDFLLSNRAVHLVGDDACSFLQSQTTNNVKTLSDQNFQFNSLLDISGKIVSSFILCRQSKNEFYILLDETLLDSTIKRIEKFHITEEFIISIVERSSCIHTHANSEALSKNLRFSGQYYFENDVISISEENATLKKMNDSKLFNILCGIQTTTTDEIIGELINNTRLDELSVNYQKGCFLGQETVAKIDSRRGASVKPVLVILNTMRDFSAQEKLISDGKKIGVINNSATYNGHTYICASLIREKRVNNSEVYFNLNGQDFVGTIHTYPYLKNSNEDMAIEFYDHAINLFQSGSETEAIRYFRKSLSLDPKFEDAYESLGVLFGRHEEYDKAIDLMEQLHQLNPKCMMALTNLSLYHMKLGHIEVAEKYKSEATFLTFEILGDEAEQKRQKEEIQNQKVAEQDRREGMYKQVLDIDSVDAMANNGMGEIEFERHSYQLAQGHFEVAIKEDAKYSVAYLGLAKSLQKQKLIQEAKIILKTGIEVASKNGDLMPANEMQAILVSL